MTTAALSAHQRRAVRDYVMIVYAMSGPRAPRIAADGSVTVHVDRMPNTDQPGRIFAGWANDLLAASGWASGRYAAYDGNAIWGIGHTPAAAIRDVLQWIDAEDTAEFQATCDTAEMTPELAAEVDSCGGNIGFGLLRDGRLGTAQQDYDEK